MPKHTLLQKPLKPNDSVCIDTVHGWHYHVPECWMAGPTIIKFKDLNKYMTREGWDYVPCMCIFIKPTRRLNATMTSWEDYQGYCRGERDCL